MVYVYVKDFWFINLLFVSLILFCLWGMGIKCVIYSEFVIFLEYFVLFFIEKINKIYNLGDNKGVE